MHRAELVGQSRAHHQLLETLDKVARMDVEVLITGPTGVGKELYARYLHQRSQRFAAPFVAVNCGGLSSDLLENELFGHVGGAFTGARAEREGLVAAAQHGTLFLDEVDTLPAPSQAKLLRFIQEKEYRRLGERQLRRADLRFVAATNVDLGQAVGAGRFREDLFFRLRVIPVEVPPLRARPEDIAPLTERFIQHYAELYRLRPVVIGVDARRRLEGYDWPGNIRELENCIRYLTCIQIARDVEPGDLPLLGPSAASERPAASFGQAKRDVVERFERERLEEALRRSEGNIARAARAEGKARRAFFELLRKHSIDATAYRRDRAS
jgi:DNA-binding NtrC family response regulator